MIRLSTAELVQILNIFRKEKGSIPEGNRIYQISRVLNVEPYLLSKLLAKRLLVFEIPLERLQANIDLVMEHKIPARNVLRGLHGLKSPTSIVRKRLEFCKEAGLTDINVTSLGYSEQHFKNHYKYTRGVKADVAGFIEYLSQRLGFSIEDTKLLMKPYNRLFERGLNTNKVG